MVFGKPRRARPLEYSSGWCCTALAVTSKMRVRLANHFTSWCGCGADQVVGLEIDLLSWKQGNDHSVSSSDIADRIHSGYPRGGGLRVRSSSVQISQHAHGPAVGAWAGAGA